VFEWISTLPVLWIALIVLAAMALLTAGIYALVVRLAQGERANAFQALSPGMLPPMGILFALFVGFLAVGVWGNVDRADDAVADEASALRAVVILSGELPPDQRGRMRALVRSQIETAVNDEWPAMEKRRADLTAIPTALAQALHLAFGFHPQGEGQVMAQRELVTAVRDALAARRQRIVVSESSVNTVKWLGALALAALTLLAIALVHSENRVTARIAMGLFAVAVAAVITMLASQDQPFAGQLGIDPDVLEQVRPRAG
jgi:multisubunit Na+/H+ antiporter MnhC subunit